MSMSLETYLRARREAQYHVQVAIEGLPNNLETPVELQVRGRVLTVFRQPAHPGMLLTPGDTIALEISIRRLGDDIPAGPAWWLEYKALLATRTLEVFLNGLAPECSVALWQARVIEGVSDVPEMRPDGREMWTRPRE